MLTFQYTLAWLKIEAKQWCLCCCQFVCGCGERYQELAWVLSRFGIRRLMIKKKLLKSVPCADMRSRVLDWALLYIRLASDAVKKPVTVLCRYDISFMFHLQTKFMQLDTDMSQSQHSCWWTSELVVTACTAGEAGQDSKSLGGFHCHECVWVVNWFALLWAHAC